jgi:hypothetical protein
MPNTATVQNSFIGGFKTEYTGLNFPENACTSVDNFIFTITGDVTRRGGFNYEANNTFKAIPYQNFAFSKYLWKNVGGDGNTQVVVIQTGPSLYFYESSAATVAAPLSAQYFASINIPSFATPPNGTFDPTVECQFADGNGVLFVYHPTAEPFYVTFSAGTLSTNLIQLRQRDFVGIPEPGVTFTFRPAALTPQHTYNLINQGWVNSSPWYGTSNNQFSATALTSESMTLASQSATSSSLVATTVQLTGQAIGTGGVGPLLMYGNVTAYNGTAGTMTVNFTSTNVTYPGALTYGTLNLQVTSTGNIGTWFQALGNYPSNADVWWEFKDSTGSFSPASTLTNITLDNAPAPNGSIVLNTFNQVRSTTAAGSLDDFSIATRPRTGCWFQGRAWFSGVDATVQAGNPYASVPYTTFTENIYFSQVTDNTINDLSGNPNYGNCYQVNDPTSENLFALLPTDGGVINIQGSGSIYKLFPITNGLLVFAANGIWLITGSGGLGFTANDYTIAKISNVRCLSGSSFINVYGYPLFWTEEGIWTVTPNTDAVPYGHGGLKVENLCIGTILTYFNNIPLVSKRYATGDFDPNSFTIQWCFRSTAETNVTSRYQYDTVLALNVINRAFYLYSISNGMVYTNGIIYVDSPGGSNAPAPIFKYLTSPNPATDIQFTFSEENDFTNYADWVSYNGTGFNYTSEFIAGYALHGQAFTRWNPEYIYLYIRNPSIGSSGGTGSGYLINGIWDFATNVGSGRISNAQQIIDFNPNYQMSIRRHRVRGRGYAFQLQVQSVPGLPLDIMGWSMYEQKAKGP